MNSNWLISFRFTTTGVYGMGSYFAICSNYSADSCYVHHVRDDIYQMFLCRVIPGISWTEGISKLTFCNILLLFKSLKA